MADVTWPGKDPDEVLDYGLDWTYRLPPGDSLAASTWSVVGGGNALLLETPNRIGTVCTVWLRAGADGTTYRVENTVTTTAGRLMQQTVSILVRSA